MNSTTRALTLAVCCLTSLSARAQADGFMPAPMPSPAPLPLPSGPPQPLPTDPIKLGIQFHGDFQGLVTTGAGASSFGVGASVGLGLNRVAFLLSPSITLAGSVTAFALGLNVRIYFKTRQQGVLVGFLKPSALVGTVGSGFFSAVYGGLGLGGGGEYLLTRNLGITAELGITFSSVGFGSAGAPSGFGALTTVGSVGVMLHQ